MPPQVKARYWLLTIPINGYTRPNELPRNCVWLRGQQERGNNTEYEHWQLFAAFKSQVRLAAVKSIFGQQCHAEPSRSEAAEQYVFKADTRIEGTQFELGSKPFKRNSATDWAAVKSSACAGRLDDIPDQIFVTHYSSLRRIAVDYAKPLAMEREVTVYWGPTGVGKSRRAWEEAGIDAYPKDPLSKFWDGYNGHKNVVIDEFRGTVSISHVLRWFDRYPVLVEVKGSSAVFKAERIWITSNLHPNEWYPDLDQSTKEALLRRLNIINIPM